MKGSIGTGQSYFVKYLAINSYSRSIRKTCYKKNVKLIWVKDIPDAPPENHQKELEVFAVDF